MQTPSLVHVVGARPQFIKMAVVLDAWQGEQKPVIIHTGQHYDDDMSQVFFDELGIPRPDHDLGAGGGTHAEQTSAMLIGLEKALDIYPKGCWFMEQSNTRGALLQPSYNGDRPRRGGAGPSIGPCQKRSIESLLIISQHCSLNTKSDATAYKRGHRPTYFTGTSCSMAHRERLSVHEQPTRFIPHRAPLVLLVDRWRTGRDARSRRICSRDSTPST